eukprot:m.111327 g.111327  ORF g.111327 m.111327 type:complete len:1291 (-) comp15950_c4_seq1:236-4108(-)
MSNIQWQSVSSCDELRHLLQETGWLPVAGTQQQQPPRLLHLAPSDTPDLDILTVLPYCEALRLTEYEVDPEMVHAIGDWLATSMSLTTLILRDCDLGPEGGRAIAEGLAKTTTLKTLVLSRTCIDGDGGLSIAAALEKNNSLAELDLSSNNIGDRGAGAIFAALKSNRVLTSLCLSDNDLWDGRQIGAALKRNKTLMALDLSKNRIASGAEIGRALAHHPTLSRLFLQGNTLDDESARAFGQALATNSALTTLRFGADPGFSEDSVSYIAEGLAKNKTLCELEGVDSDDIAVSIQRNLCLVETLQHAVCNENEQAVFSLLRSGCSPNKGNALTTAFDQRRWLICRALLHAGGCSSIDERAICERAIKAAGVSSADLLFQTNDAIDTMEHIYNELGSVRKLRKDRASSKLPLEGLASQLSEIAECYDLLHVSLVAKEDRPIAAVAVAEFKAQADAALAAEAAYEATQQALRNAVQDAASHTLPDATYAPLPANLSELIQMRNAQRGFCLTALQRMLDLHEQQKAVETGARGVVRGFLADARVRDLSEAPKPSWLPALSLQEILNEYTKWKTCMASDMDALKDETEEKAAKLRQDLVQVLLPEGEAMSLDNRRQLVIELLGAVEREKSWRLPVERFPLHHLLCGILELRVAAAECVRREFLHTARMKALRQLTERLATLGPDPSLEEECQKFARLHKEVKNLRRKVRHHRVNEEHPYSDEDERENERLALEAARVALREAENRLTEALQSVMQRQNDFPELGFLAETQFAVENKGRVQLSLSSFQRTGQPDLRGNHPVHVGKFEQDMLALKEFNVGSEEFQNFKRELQNLRRLDHPNIIMVQGYFLDDSKAYVMMPYHSGGTLDEWLNNREKGVNIEQRRRLAFQIVSAVDYCHMKQIVHGDLKPANVLVTATGDAMLTDFGNSRDTARTLAQTRTGYSQGTFGYIAPEIRSGEVTSPSKYSDIYALGVLLCKLLLDLEPRETQPPDLQMANPCEEGLRTLLQSMMHEEPLARPTSTLVLAGMPLQIRPTEGVANYSHATGCTPSHWTMGWLLDSLPSVDKINVTAELKVRMEGLLGVRVQSVMRVENSELWTSYANERMAIQRQLLGRQGWQRADLHPSTVQCAAALPGADTLMSAEAGEVYLLHGAPASVEDAVTLHGLDDRVATAGFYGRGIYFAEKSYKSQIYFRGQPGVIFVCRVLLGHTFFADTDNLAETLQQLRQGPGTQTTVPLVSRPPCVHGHFDTREKCAHDRFHSVLGDPREHTTEAYRQFREFVVYNRYQVYPEYVVKLA